MFKPGDVVICVDNTDCDLREGKEYIVREKPRKSSVYVYLIERKGETTGYGPQRFRLKNKAEFVKDFLKKTCKDQKL